MELALLLEGIDLGSVSTSMTIRTSTVAGVTTDTENDAGTYTRNGTAFQFTSTDGTVVTGSLSGNTLTLTSDGLALVYRK